MVFLIPVAVILAFIVFCALMVTGDPLNPTRPMMSYDQARDHARKLQQLIHCRTVSRQDCREEAEFEKFHRTLAELFPMVHQSSQVMTFAKGCRAYVLPGLDEEKNILFLANHDVSPAEGDWKHPPFSGSIADGKLWGRGAVSSKTSLYGIFAALEELLGEGVWPNCNVWIVTSSDGEAGRESMAAVSEFFREQKLRFELVLGQGGAVTDPPIKGMYCPKCAMVGIHERRTHNLTLKAVRDAAFDATPTERMAEFISALRRENLFIRRMTPQVESMFRALTPYMRFYSKLLFVNLWCFRSRLVKTIPKRMPGYAPLLGTDCVFDCIQTLEEGQECVASVALHSIHAGDLKQDLQRLRTLAQTYGIVLSEETVSDAEAADMAAPAYELVTDCIRSVFPDVPVIPTVLPFETEALPMTAFSDCVLRFAPLRLTAQQEATVRGVDENIDITAIGGCISFYRRLLEQYTSVWEEEANEQSEE